MAEIERRRVFGYGDRPEKSGREGVDAGVEVVDLIGPNWTIEHVESDEPERSPMNAVVGALEDS